MTPRIFYVELSFKFNVIQDIYVICQFHSFLGRATTGQVQVLHILQGSHYVKYAVLSTSRW